MQTTYMVIHFWSLTEQVFHCNCMEKSRLDCQTSIFVYERKKTNHAYLACLVNKLWKNVNFI